MALVQDEQAAVANFATAARELITTWGWQNPRSEPPNIEGMYHFMDVKGRIASGKYLGRALSGHYGVSPADGSRPVDAISPVLYKPMRACEVV